MTALLLAVIALMAVSLGGLVIFTAVTARRVEAALPPRGRFIGERGFTTSIRARGRPS